MAVGPAPLRSSSLVRSRSCVPEQSGDTSSNSGVAQQPAGGMASAPSSLTEAGVQPSGDACADCDRSFYVSSEMGRRRGMEDAYCYGSLATTAAGAGAQLLLAGVFDGHGGDAVAKFIAKRLPDATAAQLQLQQGQAAGPVTREQAAAALARALTGLDQELLASRAASLKGSTASVALVSQQEVHIAGCGEWMRGAPPHA